jgi:hypothetical protein
MGLMMSMGKGSIISSSTQQKLNMKSSTNKAELVCIDDSMSIIIWTQNFMKEQGFDIKDNVV